MIGGSFILFINLLVGALLCAFFLVLALYERRLQSARWFAIGYAFGVAYVAGEAVTPFLNDARPAFVLSFSFFLTALMLLNVGIASRYGASPRWPLLVAVFVASVVAFAVAAGMPRESIARMFLYQGPFFLMQAIGAWIVLTTGRRRAIDLTLATLLGLTGLHFLLKPLVAVTLGGVGTTSQDYLGTVYALFSQATGAVFAIATALVLMAMLVGDLLREATTRSITDPLSGLLNRRGFEERLESIASRQPSGGLPVSLVICDLDHFKSVNDSYGHAVGDRLIALFAATLRASCSARHIPGRIGGEEFAVILPGCNLAAGRLLAESVRAAFSGLMVEGLPSTARFTASFGVAELTVGETPASFMARADSALYQAKRAGRDCVRVSRLEQIIDNGQTAAAY